MYHNAIEATAYPFGEQIFFLSPSFHIIFGYVFYSSHPIWIRFLFKIMDTFCIQRIRFLFPIAHKITTIYKLCGVYKCYRPIHNCIIFRNVKSWGNYHPILLLPD